MNFLRFRLFVRTCLFSGVSCLLAGFALAAKTEVGFPRSEYFAPSDYGGHGQVFQTVQDLNGIVYVAGYAAVFAYDGERWSSIKIPDTGFLYGLALMDDDRIAVCGVGQIGFLERDGIGGRVFRSLLSEIPEAYREEIGEMWDIYATEEGLFFFTQRLMLRWREGEIRVWRFDTERMIYGLFSGSSVYVHNVGKGLYRIDGDEVVEVSTDPLFLNPGPRLIVDRSDGSQLIVTSRDGVWRLSQGEVASMETEADETLKTGIFNRGLVLPDGNLALGTFNKGLVVMSPEGKFLQHLWEGNGLPNNSITQLSLDRELGLWCSLGTGLARVDMAGSLSYYDLRNGLPSVSVREILRFKETVYLASGQGLFRLQPVELPDQPRWERVPGTLGEMFDLIEHDDSLFAAVQGTVLRIQGDTVEPVWSGDDLVRAVVPSKRDPNLLFIGTRQGLGVSAKVDGVWRSGERVAGNRIYAQSIQEMPNGDVWVGTQRSGVWRFRSSETGLAWSRGAKGVAFGEEEGLETQAPLVVGIAGDRLRVEGVGSSYLWDESSGMFELEEASLEHPPLRGWAWDVVLRDASSGNAWGSVYPLEGAADDFSLYFGRESTDGLGNRDFTWIPSEIFEPIGGVNYEYFEEDDSVLWVGGANGLMRWELDKAPLGAASFPLVPILREISVEGKEVARDDVNSAGVSEFGYNNAALRFTFAAPVMGGGIRPEYRTKLEGFEEDWTEWSLETSREFTNLSEGNYRFLAEARTALGQSEAPVTWSFVVRPPWFRSVLAYAGYLVVGAVCIWTIVRWRLAAAYKENLRLESIVADRTKALRENEGALLSARDEAERANRAKSQFLANMSHELRTPLNGILGYAQVLARDPEMTDRNRDRVAIVESSGKHLLKLINEVLDLSKIEAGRMELKLGPVSLEALLRTAQGVFQQRMEVRGLEYRASLEASLPHSVLLDEQKVGQVLFNLLGNAVKFTETGSVELRVSAGAEADTLRFSVRDTGIGISPDAQVKIFEPFKQVHTGSTREEGTGLGLAISSKLIAAMGGRIGLQSELGEGSTFWFELPLRPAEAVVGADRPAVRKRRCLDEGRRVLVVDDVAVNRGVVREMLEPLGFVVEQAGGGEEALAMIQRNCPDLVLLDMRMEPLDGAETVRRLRKMEAGHGLPVLAFSASAIGFTVENARALGCDDFISKPFDWDEMLDRIGELLDLDWEFEVLETEVKDEGPLQLKLADLQALRSLAHRGEPAGLKQRLEEIREAEPEMERLVSELLELVTRFRIRELSERLDTLEPRS